MKFTWALARWSASRSESLYNLTLWSNTNYTGTRYVHVVKQRSLSNAQATQNKITNASVGRTSSLLFSKARIIQNKRTSRCVDSNICEPLNFQTSHSHTIRPTCDATPLSGMAVCKGSCCNPQGKEAEGEEGDPTTNRGGWG